jgi:predicted DNA binding CopG/RHH family protein
MNSQKLPQTDSVQALAAFWQTHDLTDFEDELEEVTEPVFERPGMVQIRLQPEEVEAVKAVAQSRGVSHIDLIREWVLEKVRTA